MRGAALGAAPRLIEDPAARTEIKSTRAWAPEYISRSPLHEPPYVSHLSHLVLKWVKMTEWRAQTNSICVYVYEWFTPSSPMINPELKRERERETRRHEEALFRWVHEMLIYKLNACVLCAGAEWMSECVLSCFWQNQPNFISRRVFILFDYVPLKRFWICENY